MHPTNLRSPASVRLGGGIFSKLSTDPHCGVPFRQLWGEAPWRLWGIPWPGRRGAPDSGFLPIQVALALSVWAG